MNASWCTFGIDQAAAFMQLPLILKHFDNTAGGSEPSLSTCTDWALVQVNVTIMMPTSGTSMSAAVSNECGPMVLSADGWPDASRVTNLSGADNTCLLA